MANVVVGALSFLCGWCSLYLHTMASHWREEALGSNHNLICFSNMLFQNPFSTWQIHHFTVFLQRKDESKEAREAPIFSKGRLGYYSILPASSFSFLLVSVALPSVFEGGLVNSSQQETFWKWISLLSKQRSHYLPSKRGGGVTKLATMETLQLPSLQQLSLLLWHPLLCMLHCCVSMHFCIRLYCISADCCICFHCCICLSCLGLCICERTCDVSETKGSFVLLCDKWVDVCYIYVCVQCTCMHVMYTMVYVGTHAVAREGLHMTCSVTFYFVVLRKVVLLNLEPAWRSARPNNPILVPPPSPLLGLKVWWSHLADAWMLRI